MFERVKKLHEVADPTDKAELSIQSAALQNAMTAHRDGASSATLKSWQANKEALQDLIDRLYPKYFPEVGLDAGDRFKNRKAAADWLEKHHHLKRSKFYEDVSRGFAERKGRRVNLTLHPDKSISRYQVMEYAELHRSSAPPAAAVDFSGQMQSDEARKLKAEADIKEMQAENARREMDRDWLHRDQADLQLHARLVALRDAVRYHLARCVPRIIHIVGGNPSTAAELADLLEQDVITRACNDLARDASDEIEIEFTAGEFAP